MNFNTIPEALEDLRQGTIILVTDDPFTAAYRTNMVLAIPTVIWLIRADRYTTMPISAINKM